MFPTGQGRLSKIKEAEMRPLNLCRVCGSISLHTRCILVVNSHIRLTIQMHGNMKILGTACFAVLLLLGCSSLRNSMVKTGESIKEVAIQNAIMDFFKNCSLFQKDSVFCVSFEDTLYGLALKQKDERSFHWVRDRFYDGL